jgi:heme-degrading monooxygenase HmoA
MIARTWRGWTRTSDADAYVEYLRMTGMREYRETPGNRAAYILRREEEDRTEFVTLTFWDSIESVNGFAGEDIERARSSTHRTTGSCSIARRRRAITR